MIKTKTNEEFMIEIAPYCYTNCFGVPQMNDIASQLVECTIETVRRGRFLCILRMLNLTNLEVFNSDTPFKNKALQIESFVNAQPLECDVRKLTSMVEHYADVVDKIATKEPFNRSGVPDYLLRQITNDEWDRFNKCNSNAYLLTLYNLNVFIAFRTVHGSCGDRRYSCKHRFFHCPEVLRIVNSMPVYDSIIKKHLDCADTNCLLCYMSRGMLAKSYETRETFYKRYFYTKPNYLLQYIGGVDNPLQYASLVFMEVFPSSGSVLSWSRQTVFDTNTWRESFSAQYPDVRKYMQVALDHKNVCNGENCPYYCCAVPQRSWIPEAYNFIQSKLPKISFYHALIADALATHARNCTLHKCKILYCSEVKKYNEEQNRPLQAPDPVKEAPSAIVQTTSETVADAQVPAAVDTVALPASTETSTPQVPEVKSTKRSVATALMTLKQESSDDDDDDDDDETGYKRPRIKRLVTVEGLCAECADVQRRLTIGSKGFEAYVNPNCERCTFQTPSLCRYPKCPCLGNGYVYCANVSPTYKIHVTMFDKTHIVATKLPRKAGWISQMIKSYVAYLKRAISLDSCSDLDASKIISILGVGSNMTEMQSIKLILKSDTRVIFKNKLDAGKILQLEEMFGVSLRDSADQHPKRTLTNLLTSFTTDKHDMLNFDTVKQAFATMIKEPKSKQDTITDTPKVVTPAATTSASSLEPEDVGPPNTKDYFGATDVSLTNFVEGKRERKKRKLLDARFVNGREPFFVEKDPEL